MTSQPKRNQEAFFSGEGRVLKVTFIRGGSTSRSNLFTLSSVADIGKGLGEPGPPPPLIFRPNWGPKGRKIFLFRPGIPLIAGWPPPLSECLYPPCLCTGPYLTEKEPTSYTFHWQMVLLSQTYIFQKKTPPLIWLVVKEQFLCYINLVLDLLRWAGWTNSLNKAFQKIAPWLTSLELSFLFTCFECTVF